MTDAEEQALSKNLASSIADKIGATSEDVMTFKKVGGSVKLFRGTTVLDWLPQTWPGRTSPDGETTLIACVVRTQQSTVFIAESAVNQPVFKEAIVESIGAALGSSQAITGPMTVLADYIGPVNMEKASDDSFNAGSSATGSTQRMPWSTDRASSGGGFNWGLFLVVSLVILLIIGGIVGLTQRQRNRRSGGFLSMLGREPPRETWRDHLHDMVAPFWKKPTGGYGMTGH